jgi:5-hydroxyisourate hydrolase
MGRLTTHVLDTSSGAPAPGMTIQLLHVDDAGEHRLVKSVRTNADGRVDVPLLEGDALRVGRYRLLFEVGAYFRDRGAALPEPAFLEVVPLDFGIADRAAHYHVPLLVSPWAYSTYRGS